MRMQEFLFFLMEWNVIVTFVIMVAVKRFMEKRTIEIQRKK